MKRMLGDYMRQVTLHVIGLLLENGVGSAKLSQDFCLRRRSISFHLDSLESVGLVKEDKTVKKYKLTAHDKRIYNHISSLRFSAR